jgi:hypothetical protein
VTLDVISNSINNYISVSSLTILNIHSYFSILMFHFYSLSYINYYEFVTNIHCVMNIYVYIFIYKDIRKYMIRDFKSRLIKIQFVLV